MPVQKKLPIKAPATEVKSSNQKTGSLAFRGLVAIKEHAVANLENEKIYLQARAIFNQCIYFYFAEGSVLFASKKLKDLESSYKTFGELKTKGFLKGLVPMALLHKLQYKFIKDLKSKSELCELAFEWAFQQRQYEDPEVLHDLGFLYFKGIHIPNKGGRNFGAAYNDPDYTLAYLFTKKAAEKGYVNAYLNLSYLYEKGLGSVKVNKKAAFKWLKKAAEAGHAEAQNRLALTYDKGWLDIDINYNEAFKWYEKSALKEHDYANRNCGGCYHYGFGINVNEEKAYKYYLKAQKLGLDVNNSLGYLFYNRKDGKKDYKKAFNYFSKDKDNIDSKRMIAYMYAYGKGIEKDFNKAFDILKKNSEDGHAASQNTFAYLFAKSDDQKENPDLEFFWTFKSAEQNNRDAMAHLGRLYERGIGTSKDIEKAIYWYEKSDNGYANLLLGKMYFDGKEKPLDYLMAFKYFEISAQLKDSEGQAWLAYMYEYGKGCEKDLDKAIEWYGKSAEDEFDYSQKKLLELVKIK